MRLDEINSSQVQCCHLVVTVNIKQSLRGPILVLAQWLCKGDRSWLQNVTEAGQNQQ